ncbi:MAG: polysaccharide biosynthesis tyrosine autokinase [Oscillospiraceae bacterium]|nr:polysaccharide biosynthesis tyrosine autokinase [Oscillospiraceae bacterium]
MDEKLLNNDEIEIDLQRLFSALVNKSWLIGIVAVLFAVVTLLGTVLFVTPKYQSTAMFYVNNNNLSIGEASLSISSSDISASRGLVKSYIIILQTRETLNDVIDYSGVDRTYGQMKSMITAAAVDSTEIFEVVVTSEDPAEAEKIADAIAHILPKRISSIIEGTSAKVVDAAVLPTKASSPNYTKNTMLGFAVGMALAAAVILLTALLDNTIRSEDDITSTVKYPILASVPDMKDPGKGGKYGRYGYGYRKRYGYGYGYGYGATKKPKDGKLAIVGPNISFAASEAYKLLRTKVTFSFTDEGCHVVGVSSSINSEGKSVSSINLAYSMSQLNKRVLLIDCDMRRPTVPKKLPVAKTPGLSDYLTGQEGSGKVIQMCNIKGDEQAFHVISAGRIPPNPMELLSSEKMEKLLERLRGHYDYIILDLPPVEEVGDALAAAKYLDGILMVVRQNGCDRISLSNAVRQFEFVDTRILGIVFNGISEERGKYNKYYRKYYGQAYYDSAKKNKS